jgi:ABC-type transport system involved in Fe-S cluster assembly fused permease/ATPase subunit
LTVFIFTVTFIMRWLLVKVWRIEFKQEIKQAKRRRRR